MSATVQQQQAVFQVIRSAIDSTGWGGWVSDDKLRPFAVQAANACVAAAPKPAPAPANPPAQGNH